MNANEPFKGDAIPITLEQQKLLASAIRIQILHLLAQEPRTAKQVADLLGQSPGNVHYHIQRLHDGGLIELTETREVGGIVEKYYKAHHTRFHLIGFPDSQKGKERLMSHLLLTAKEREELRKELEALLLRWESRIPTQSEEPLEEVEVLIQLQRNNKEGGR
ncbi:winged helix-turn-helix transcriptional regulator [Brevibacillus sp. SYP-B805]|uniref:ArsR/SmtB family transcription factor n=1 Tax=Brevibacillus sp. SYP-B805 TaxID=1578199 RepID=UPI0013EB9E12|nr:winged helix-turn-helix domain-containing protein [Brevibacillus sp. SYP-B805]NGQ94202.1 winged helix-turn-helix transcriptional regulator [Brevibacillus sp. SYP-B805]